jgi:hypothetical protein
MTNLHKYDHLRYKQLHNGRVLTLREQEEAKQREQKKEARKQVIAKAQALERKAARMKMQRERAAAKNYEYDPA